MKHTPETVVLVNCGCNEIQTIARGVRAEHIYTMVMPYTVSAERVIYSLQSQYSPRRICL